MGEDGSTFCCFEVEVLRLLSVMFSLLKIREFLEWIAFKRDETH